VLLFLGAITGTLFYFLVVVHFYKTASNIAWLKESYFFSGVTLLLPLYCSCAAGIAMCYMKMRQSFLISEERTKNAGPILGQAKEYESLWIPQSMSVASKPAKKPKSDNAAKTESTTARDASSVVGWGLVCVCAPIWYLVCVWLSTYNTSNKPVLFWLTWSIIAAGFVIWWLASFELFLFQKLLRSEAKTFEASLTAPQKRILETLHKGELRGVYRLLVGPGPSKGDAVAKYKSPDENAKWVIPTKSELADAPTSEATTISTLYEFRKIQYRFVIIKNQFGLLMLGALFLFAAAVAYPFTSGMMMRSFAICTILALAGGVCLCIILGTTPNEFEMSPKNLSFFGSYALVATVVLVSQFVPGAWMALGRLIGPLLQIGH
jgi:hypothetical protein